jgi:hypothetical protein
MKNYQKLFIGITAICLIAICTVPASAAIPKKTATKLAIKAKDYITQTSKSIGNAIWNNKGAVAVGTAAVVIATNPEATAAVVTGVTETVTTGATAVITGATEGVSRSVRQSSGSGSIWYLVFFAAATVFCIVVIRYIWNYVRDWKNWIPLAVIGIFLCFGGIAEAGIIGLPTVDGITNVISKPPVPFWTFFNVVLCLVTIFI